MQRQDDDDLFHDSSMGMIIRSLVNVWDDGLRPITPVFYIFGIGHILDNHLLLGLTQGNNQADFHFFQDT